MGELFYTSLLREKETEVEEAEKYKVTQIKSKQEQLKNFLVCLVEEEKEVKHKKKQKFSLYTEFFTSSLHILKHRSVTVYTRLSISSISTPRN